MNPYGEVLYDVVADPTLWERLCELVTTYAAWLYSLFPSSATVGAIWGTGTVLLLVGQRIRYPYFSAKGLEAAFAWPLLVASWVASGTFGLFKKLIGFGSNALPASASKPMIGD
jgi:hypothetical protein